MSCAQLPAPSITHRDRDESNPPPDCSTPSPPCKPTTPRTKEKAAGEDPLRLGMCHRIPIPPPPPPSSPLENDIHQAPSSPSLEKPGMM